MGDWDPSLRYITLAQAATVLLDLSGKAVKPLTIWTWCRKGIRSRSGERVHLRHARLGNSLFTTPRWLEEFGLRVAEADAKYFDAPARTIAPSQAPSQRLADIEAAERDLREMGVLEEGEQTGGEDLQGSRE